MAGYKLQGKRADGKIVDVPLAATYDIAGNNIAEKLSLMVDTFTVNDREALFAKLKPLLKKYYFSFEETEEVSEEEFERMWEEEFASGSTEELLEFLPEFLFSLVLPKEYGGEGLINEARAEFIGTKTYNKIIASASEDDELNLFQICTSTDAPNQLDILLIDSSAKSDIQGRLKLINDNQLGHSDASYGWSVGSDTIRLPRFGVYLVEFYTDASACGIGLCNCSIGTYYGQSYTGGSKESYTPFVTSASNYSSSGALTSSDVKVYPYRDSGSLKLRVEALDYSFFVDVAPSTVKYYQII